MTTRYFALQFLITMIANLAIFGGGFYFGRRSIE